LIQDDGKILVFGTVRVASNKFALLTVRLLSDGSGYDSSFGTDGILKISGSSNEAIQSLILQADSQVLAGGSTGGFDSKFLLGRFSTEGVKDMNFGNNNGWSVNDIGPGFNFDGITGMVQLNNGDIIAAGTTLEDSFYDYAVAKFSSTLSSLNDLTNHYSMGKFRKHRRRNDRADFKLAS